ncbi:MAG: NAD(P)/FAD-dependent oxidoreductase [Chloroflexia bacterium]
MRHIIVGNGIAGVTAALELARRGAGEILIYGAELYPYYYRPRLPFFLAGEIPQEQLYAHPPSWYEQRGIQVHTGTGVARLEPGQKRVILDNGEAVPYDRLLLATGSFSFIPPLEGAGKRGVFSLRTLDDALAIREHAARSQQAAVIGGGLLGLEAARALSRLGLEVTVLEYFGHLLPRQLDAEGAALLQRQIEAMGIHVALQADTQAILGNDEVKAVRLKDGREFPAQLVLIATGVRCNVNLAAAAGLAVDRGVIVDASMATSAPDIYAAGDVASFQGRSWGIIPVAIAQATVAAANMAGNPEQYKELPPTNTLKVTGIDVLSVGTVNPEEKGYQQVRAISPDGRRYIKVVLYHGTLVGAIVIGNRSLGRKVETMVGERTRMRREEAEALLLEL